MWQCFDLTYRKHGLYRGLYAGTMPAVATSIVENSLLYGTYSYCQRVMADLKGVAGTSNLSLLDDACAGSISAMLSTLVLCPSEVLKCKLQAIQEVRIPDFGSRCELYDTPDRTITDVFRKLR